MIEHGTQYGISVKVNLPYDRAVDRIRAEIDIGLLLPCNVIVYAADEPGMSVIAALDPIEALDLTGNTRIRPVAEEARDRLVRALEAAQTPW